MFHPDLLIEVLHDVFTLHVLYWITVGTIIGVLVGSIPGLTASTGIALLLPLTFRMDTASTLGLLLGIYKGSEFGGAISAISFGVPGTPAAVATGYDGYKLMKKGKGRKAILMALYSSVTGDTASDVITIFITPILAMIALKFGPPERFWVVVLAFTLLGTLSGRHLAKGLLSGAIGLFLGTIGSDPVSAVSRNTFGLWWLQDGIHLIPLMIGIFAISRMLEETSVYLLERGAANYAPASLASFVWKKGEGLSFREYLSCWKEMLLGLFIGTFVGIIPGLGGTAASMLSYSTAKQLSPEKQIGTGVLEGVAAAESANSATVGPTLVPLLAFGIPGSSAAALIGSALLFQGATPSPRMFELYPKVVYTLFVVLIVANGFNLVISRMLSGPFSRLGQLPKPFLIPLILTLAVMGTYSVRGNEYDIIVMLSMGVIGYCLRLFKIPDAPLVITFLISPLMEGSFRRALLLGHNDWMRAFFGSNLSIGLIVATLVLTYVFLRLRGRAQDAPE